MYVTTCIRSAIVNHPNTSILLASISFTVAAALIAGGDQNWDLQNYHFWAAHALINGRTFLDVAPGQIQSWLNPTAYVPFYYIVQNLSPFSGTVVAGAFAGLNGILLYHLTRRVIHAQSQEHVFVTGVLICACGLTAPMFLAQLGTSLDGPLLSLLVLGGLLSLYLLSPYRFLYSGLLLGAAVGLKLTLAPFAIATTVALVVDWKAWRLSTRRFAGFAIGGIAGAVLTGGAWAVYLYMETGSPAFPFYNTIFNSPLFLPIDVADARFLPEGFLDAASYPFQWLFGLHPSSELPFKDARFALIVVLFSLAAMAVSVRSLRKRRTCVNARDFRFISIFFLVSFSIWLALWGIQRYLTVLELISGLVIFVCLDRLIASPRFKIPIFAMLIVFCVAWTNSLSWGRLNDFGDHYFLEDKSAFTEYSDDTLFVIVADGHPLSYVIPFFPEGSRFVRLSGNFGEAQPDRLLGKVMNQIIATHVGPIRTLSTREPSPADRVLLASFGLSVDKQEPCATIKMRTQQLRSCGCVGLNRVRPH